jgi:hypothetical protein
MHIRWFGRPWGTANQRAPICEDDAYEIEVPVDTICLVCKNPIIETSRGLVTAASPAIENSWTLETEEGDYPVVSYHAKCFFSETIGTSIGYVIHDDEFEMVQLKEPEDETVQIGRGWKRYR